MILHKLHLGSQERYNAASPADGKEKATADQMSVPPAISVPASEEVLKRPSVLARGMTQELQELMKREGEQGKKKALKKGKSNVTEVDSEQTEQIFQTKRELVGLRTIVRQLQGEQDKDAAALLDYDHRLETMKMEIMKCKKELAATLTKKDWHKLDAEVEEHVEGMKKYMSKWSEKQIEKLKEEQGLNIGKLESWFEDHDQLAKKRQSALDKKVASCARVNELAELKENLEADQGILNERVEKAARELRMAMDRVDMMTQKNTLGKLDKVRASEATRAGVRLVFC